MIFSLATRSCSFRPAISVRALRSSPPRRLTSSRAAPLGDAVALLHRQAGVRLQELVALLPDAPRVGSVDDLGQPGGRVLDRDLDRSRILFLIQHLDLDRFRDRPEPARANELAVDGVVGLDCDSHRFSCGVGLAPPQLGGSRSLVPGGSS
jgi:hypothetical protein